MISYEFDLSFLVPRDSETPIEGEYKILVTTIILENLMFCYMFDNYFISLHLLSIFCHIKRWFSDVESNCDKELWGNN